MELSPKNKLIREWLFTQWCESFGLIMESMADERPVLEQSAESEAPGADAFLWRQRFAITPEPAFWVATSTSTAVDIGWRTLRAAGVESTEEEDGYNTYLEILNQSLSALGQAMTNHLGSEAVATEGEKIAAAPNRLEWTAVRIAFGSNALQPIWLACSSTLLEIFNSGPKQAPTEVTQPSQTQSTSTAETHIANSIGSKTFDLLLDVALPVSVSFGRTFVPLKEVLKLNTGSIVELDRGVNEMVDIIINNCVIARGEVVVVEGNYGVRILQIASRYDRLRTGTSAAQVQHSLALG